VRLKLESDILDQKTRAALIEEIEGQENKNRKFEAYKRYQCYKDRTSHYVVELLLRQFEGQTVEEMRYALSNISFVRKIVDKLARVYSSGIDRRISESPAETEKLKKIEKSLDVNSVLKKVNRFVKLEKNTDLFVKPCPVIVGDEIKYKIKLEALLPYLYDAVEDYYDREKAMCIILSDYTPPSTSLAAMDGARAPSLGAVPTPNGDGKDQKIADSPSDQKDHTAASDKTYVFWSKNYHFECKSNGEIIPRDDNPNNVNPFGVSLHIPYSLDQDGSFWAEGGGDLIDGAILLNALITHTNHVGTVQGYGQFYMTGENLPRSIKVGPTRAIIAEYKKDEQAEPKMGFLNANPQLDSLRGLIEMYVALLLTTNNLSTSGVSTQLQGGQTLASGVALIIDKAESIEDVQDQRSAFSDREVDVFSAINAILTTYGDQVVDELKGLAMQEGFEKNFTAHFQDPATIMSEKEKLDNMKMRKDMGLESMVSLLMKDDETLTEKQAEEKLLRIIEQRLKEKMIEIEAAKKTGVTLEGDQTIEGEGDEETTTVTETTTAEVPSGGVGDTTGGEDVQKLALNGSQVESLISIVEKAATNSIPRESAIQMIMVSFNVDQAQAERLLSTAGKGFVPAAQEPNPAPAPINEEDPEEVEA